MLLMEVMGIDEMIVLDGKLAARYRMDICQDSHQA